MAEEPTTVEEEPGDDGATYTKADVSRIVSERLAKERVKLGDVKALQAKAARLDELEAAQKSAEEKAAEGRAAAERERDAARLELLQMRVATAKGLPADMAGRLRGTTEEELGKDADELLKLLKPPAQQTAARPVPELRSGALPGSDAQHLSPSALIDAAIRQSARRK